MLLDLRGKKKALRHRPSHNNRSIAWAFAQGSWRRQAAGKLGGPTYLPMRRAVFEAKVRELNRSA